MGITQLTSLNWHYVGREKLSWGMIVNTGQLLS